MPSFMYEGKRVEHVLKTHPFPDSCAGVVFSHFGHCPSHPHHGNPDLDVIAAWLDSQEAFQLKVHKRSFCMIQLTGAQEKVLGDFLVNRGYQRIKSAINRYYKSADSYIFILHNPHFSDDPKTLDEWMMGRRVAAQENVRPEELELA